MIAKLFFILIIYHNGLLAQNVSISNFYLGSRDDNFAYPCQSDKDCEIFIHSKCINDTCSCPQNTSCVEIETIEIITTLGEKCNEKNRSCRIDNAHCFNNTCVCEEGFVESASKQTCLEGHKKAGEECVENNQCFSHHCHHHRCSRHVALGKSCLSSSECNHTTEFSHCQDGKCECLDRYISNGGKCYLVSRDLLSPCEVDAQCTKILGKSAECRQERCVCPNGYNYESLAKKCVIVTEFNGSCALVRCFSFKLIVFVVFLLKIFL